MTGKEICDLVDKIFPDDKHVVEVTGIGNSDKYGIEYYVYHDMTLFIKFPVYLVRDTTEEIVNATTQKLKIIVDQITLPIYNKSNKEDLSEI